MADKEKRSLREFLRHINDYTYRFNPEKGQFRYRELRGVRDTAFDFYMWLKCWKDMVAFVAKCPVSAVRALFRYQWFATYLTYPNFVDRGTLGMRGNQLRMARAQYDRIVKKATDLLRISFVADDSSTKFAAQAIAGLAYAVGDRANIDLTYRYLTGDAEFDTSSSGTGANFGTFEGDYDNSHTVTLGLRYAFGAEPAPAPAPLPPAPPAPVAPPRPVAPVAPPAPVARQFVVYFDWDQSSLTSEANSIIGQAAAYARTGQPTRVLVVGHADTSGSAAYNVGLSNRRARTVADALVAQGIAGGVVSLDGRGETELARATADGVREPLNRRATIDINF